MKLRIYSRHWHAACTAAAGPWFSTGLSEHYLVVSILITALFGLPTYSSKAVFKNVKDRSDNAANSTRHQYERNTPESLGHRLACIDPVRPLIVTHPQATLNFGYSTHL